MPPAILTRLQSDCAALLARVPALAAANILADNEGDIESRVKRALQTISETTGQKSGLAIVVMLPDVSSAESNLPGPPLIGRVEIQVIEQVLINQDPARGTLISAGTAALRVLGALHLHLFGDLLLYAGKEPVQSLPMPKGHISYVVALECRLSGVDPIEKPADVTAAIADGRLVLACATPATQIIWCRDGSYPAPGNPGCQLYIAPLLLDAGTVVRTAAYAGNMNPGNVLELTITA